MDTRVTRLLDAAGIAYQFKRHSRPVFTSEEAAIERGVRVAQIIKTMIAATADGIKIAALIPGDRQLDWKKLRQACGQRRLTLVPRERIEAVTGYPPGAIAPVGLPGDFNLFADTAFLQQTTVSISSGSPEAGLVLRREDLFRLLPVAVADIAKCETTP